MMSIVVRRIRAAAALVAVGLTCLLLGACGGASSTSTGATKGGGSPISVNKPFQPEGTPVRGGVLTFARGVQPASFTPWIGEGNAELMIQMQIYDQVVEATPDPSVLAPGLADSWRVSDDKLVYTFHVRQGVRFSNGQPLKAEDIKFSLDTERNPKIDANRSTLLTAIRSIEVTDPEHIRMTLNRVTPAILNYLTLMNIVSEREIKRLGDRGFGTQPVGTGPFMVTSFSPGNPTIQLKRNPHYWREGLPYLDGITYKYIADDNARMLAVESGSADIAEGVPFSQLDRVGRSPGTQVFSQHAFASDWILVNGFRGPLSKVPVRQALVYATPLERISQIVFHGVAPVSATANMPTKYLDTSIQPYPYDVARARRLLADAGYDGLTLRLTISSGDAVAKQVATILQASWAQAGIRLVIQERDYASAINDLVKGDFDLINLRPTDQTSDVSVDDEFDTFFVAPPKPGNFPFHGWENAQARRLVEEATTTFDEATRRRAFSEYQQILHEEQPIISLVYVPNLFAVRTNVHNFVAVGTFWPLLGRTWLAK